ncbi:MAG: alpha-ketoacid dehydrogenase subunit beta [Hyphomicrobiales bacterium]|nr:alpha-ketoacid dehydrogenase subunit beta [Hyphomicrobiales bacterium]
MGRMTYAEASILALREEMRRDPRVWALGEDIGRGGIGGQYKGLQDEFGAQRICDTPISESTIMGVGVGAALAGTRPVIELRITDFALCSTDEIVNQAAKVRYMLGGQARAPLVVRQPNGMCAGFAAQHSQSTEAWWIHTPGLVVVAPSTPRDNRALLKAAIRSDDPVIYLEHKEMWGVDGEVPDAEETIELGKARVAREGRDLTIVTWSKTASFAEEAARTLAGEGIEAEVVDLRTLYPWDRDCVIASVERTGRLLVAQESVEIGGFGAEIVADVTQHAFGALKAPPARIGAPRTPVPYSQPLEEIVRVDAPKIAAAARRVAAARRG